MRGQSETMRRPPAASGARRLPAGGRAGAKLGMWSALATAGLAVTSAVVGVTTPPRSGPMCQVSACVTAPYTDVAAFVPRDYLWLYPALALQVAFLLLVAVLAGGATRDRPVPAVAALAFAVLGAGLLVADYGLQLVVVQPSLLAGESQGLTLLSQYNPHGLFIGLENLGYAAVAVAFVFLGALLGGFDRLLDVARWVFVAGGVGTWVALVGLAAGYRADLEYRFELAGISLSWLVLASAGALLAVAFRRAGTMPAQEQEETP